MLSNMQVQFAIPPDVLAGLGTRQYERLGGVIRESGSKHVVMWLRESSSELTKHTPQALNQLFLSASMMQSGALLLNLALSTIHLHNIQSRLADLESSIQGLNQQFIRDRDVDFSGAMRTSEDALNSTNLDVKREHATRAIDGFYRALENSYADFQATLTTNKTVAQHALTRAMYALLGSVNLHLELDEQASAKRNLAKEIPKFLDFSQRLVEELVSPRQALYFDKSVKREDTERFIKVRQWLESPHDFQNVPVLNVVDLVRSDFWDMSVRNVSTGMLNNPFKVIEQFNAYLDGKVSALGQAELIIENYNHLLGYQLELAYLKLANKDFNEWRNISVDLQHAEDGIICLIPNEPIQLAI